FGMVSGGETEGLSKRGRASIAMGCKRQWRRHQVKKVLDVATSRLRPFSTRFLAPGVFAPSHNDFFINSPYYLLTFA
ncbi:MAG: hypothetical protein AB1921_12040, partial [Thermodesulfobacteriota bacterium]